MFLKLYTPRPPIRHSGTDTRHTTEDELLFLHDLGRWKHQQTVSRATLLRQYIKAASVRRRWGSVDKRTCLAYAFDALLHEDGHICREVA